MKVFSLFQHSVSLQVAALTYIHLQFPAKPRRIHYRIIGSLGYVYQDTLFLLLHVQFSRTMAALTINTFGYTGELVFAPCIKTWQGVVAAHALVSNQTRESTVLSVLKSRRKVPLSFLSIPGQ